MPLRAVIAGEIIYAFLVAPSEWRVLQSELRANRSIGRLPCCGALPIAKTSKRGTQFFAHYARTGCEIEGETEIHLRAKRELYEGCIAAGWQATTEESGPEGDWRADVLASRGQRRVAFEIQWSPQSEVRTIERQQALARDGVRGCWLFRRTPIAIPQEATPAFQLLPLAGGKLQVTLGQEAYSLAEFAGLMLSGRVRFRPEVTAHFKNVACRVRRDHCPKCRAEVHIIDGDAPDLTSLCGLALSEFVEFLPLQRVYAEWLEDRKALYGEDLALGPHDAAATHRYILRSPPGKPFLTAAGRSGFCPICLSIVPVTDAIDHLPIAFEVRARITPPAWPRVVFPHWCIAREAGWCGLSSALLAPST